MSTNIGGAAAHRRPTDCNVVENLMAIWRNDELLKVRGRAGKNAGSVTVPLAVSVDRQSVEQLLERRMDCEPDVARELSQVHSGPIGAISVPHARPERLGDGGNACPPERSGVIPAGLSA